MKCIRELRKNRYFLSALSSFPRVVKVNLAVWRQLHRRSLFINVYTRNKTSTSSSTALVSSYFPAVHFNHLDDIPRCSAIRNVVRIPVDTKGGSKTQVVHWSRDVIFEWPKTTNSTDFALFIQPSFRRHGKRGLFNVEVYHQ